MLFKSTSEVGAYGEKVAAKFLKKQGYKIVGKNFVSAHGEIDLIAKKDGTLVFVEVKSRKDCAEYFESYGMPCEAVTKKKQQNIIFTARIYLEKNPCNLEIRFDVIEVFLAEKNRVNHIENAFYL